MDESGFAVGTSQTSRALVNVRDKTSWKKIQGRQEGITAIEVVDAAGVVGPPLLIFKSKHQSTARVPDHAPPDWSFTTSKSGWTSDSHGYQWLTEVFEPWSRRRLPDPAARRMLIMDGHSSRLASLRPLYPPNRYEALPYLSPAASRNALRASAYRSQRSSTCSTVSSPRPHSHAGLSASFFLNRQALSPQCSVRAYTRMDALSEDRAPYRRNVCLPD